MSRTKGALLPLVRPDELAHVIAQAIDERFDGRIAAASAASRVSRSWLRRMLGRVGKVPKAIHPAVIPGLKVLVGKSRLDQLQGALIPRAVEVMVARHQDWLAHVRQASGRGSGVWWTLEGGRIKQGRSRKNANRRTQREAERDALQEHIRRNHPYLFKRIKKYMAYAIAQGRAQLVLSRILDPLLESAETGFIEPSWRDLTRAELENAISLGLRREQLLTPRIEPQLRAMLMLAFGDARFRRRWLTALNRRQRPYREQKRRYRWEI